MKGYRMVLLVNGGIFIFIALSALFLAQILSNEADECAATTPDSESCAQTRDASTTSFRVSPILAVLGFVLLLLGSFLGRTSADRQPLRRATGSGEQRMPTDWTAALRDGPAGLMIDVEVVPNSSSPGFPVGFNPWRKRIQARVAAPAEDGKANEELVILVAAALTIPRTSVSIVEGHASRRKRLEVQGVTAAEFTRRVVEAAGER